MPGVAETAGPRPVRGSTRSGPAAPRPERTGGNQLGAEEVSLDQKEFEAAAMGSTREQLLAKFGPPDELGEWGPSVGWDGPVSIYHGPFTSAEGEKKKALVYYRKSGESVVVTLVGFSNQ